MSNDAAHSEWSSAVIRDLLTTDRLRSYLIDAGDDTDAALRLYEWNLAASAAIMQTTAMLEVVVRNALDRQLVAWAASRGAGSWLDVAPLDERGLDDLAQATQRATGYGKSQRLHGKVVAELSFGFWRYLTAQRYHASLWVPALHHAFPHGDPDIRQRRRRVERHLARLMLVRNRAAHHEPIHRRNLTNDLAVAIDVLTWIHQDAGAWVAEKSMIPAVVAARPSPD